MLVNIQTKSGTEREVIVKDTLEKIIAEYPCPIFTSEVLIEPMVIPHSHLVLTLNVRNTDPILVLRTFVHEQFHWFASTKSTYDACISYLKKYPNLGDCNKSGKHPNSFWEHLIVNWNTRNFITNNLTQEQINFIDTQPQAYPLTDKFVQANFEVLSSELAQFGMVWSIN